MTRKITNSLQILAQHATIGNNCTADAHSKFLVEEGGELIIGDNCIFKHATIRVCRGAKMTIGANSTIKGSVKSDLRSRIEIASGLYCNEKVLIRSAEGSLIKIGENCLFSDVTIYNTDYHSIFSRDTLERVNFSADVVIGKCVWAAMRSIILKGSVIGDGSVIGAGSIVSGKFPPNVVVAGNPAKVVRSDIIWDKKLRRALDPATVALLPRRETEPTHWLLRLFRSLSGVKISRPI